MEHIGHELYIYVHFGTGDSIMELVRKAEEMTTRGIIVESKDAGMLFLELCSHFKSIEAGGGVVFNEKGQLLMIHRAGKWDLPKGKVDAGERIDEAAIREVQEECGLKFIQLVKKLPTTYHTYKLHGHRFMKVSHWFEMRSHSNELLVPQLEESITEVVWTNWENVHPDQINTYSSISELLMILKSGQFGTFPSPNIA